MSNEPQELKSSKRIGVAYLSEKFCRIVVCGIPFDDDETHNCDEMGCGQEHVVALVEIDRQTYDKLKALP